MKYLLVLLFFFAVALPAAAAPVLEGTHKDWKLFRMSYSGKNLCYITSAPVKQQGTFKKRGNPYAIVTRRNTSLAEINISSGYPYKPNRDVRLSVGGKTWDLFTQGEQAWAKTEKDDTSIIAAMKRENRMTVKATSAKNTSSQDTFSLAGFSAAFDHMQERCKD